ncbi:MAG: hypothetical protein M0004_06180 [Actinomycetota bacterium]|nr:hypothetical protein [Actinomycetota bacterium]
MHPDENPTESLDDEGMPDLYDQPPGIDVETEQEGMMPPAEHSIATGSDPAYPNTPAEERRGETVAERAARELPDLGEGDLDDVDERAADRALPHHLVDVDELNGQDVEDEEIAEVAEFEDESDAPEESALHLADDAEIDDLDPEIERAQYLEGR